VWLSEINLGIGRGEGTYQGINREWLYWYDEKGERYLTPEERISQNWTEGKRTGKLEGKQELIFGLIKQKFGRISLIMEEKIIKLSESELDELALNLVNFSQAKLLEEWLEDK
jgi:hypothetical protein